LSGTEFLGASDRNRTQCHLPERHEFIAARLSEPYEPCSIALTVSLVVHTACARYA
jgi:hypothetical protein